MSQRARTAALAVLLVPMAAGMAGAQQRCNLRIAEPIFRKFQESRATDSTTAAMLAREYLKACADSSVSMTRDAQSYLTAFEMNALLADRGSRRAELSDLIHVHKNFAEAYDLGAKLIERDSTDLDVLINLGYGGFVALQAQNRQFDSLAVRYGGRAIQLLENGATRTTWDPFASRDETLAWLHFALGTLQSESNPLEAARHLHRAASFETSLKAEPSLYYVLASAYEAAVYQPLYQEYTTKFGGKPVSEASRQAKARIDAVMDRLIDIYAHAIAYEQPTAPERANAMQRAEAYYRARHGAQAAGLQQLIDRAKTTALIPLSD